MNLEYEKMIRQKKSFKAELKNLKIEKMKKEEQKKIRLKKASSIKI